ncbi:MAG TPA: hypothetical protein VHN19_16515 [Burkholderiales bacterium]|jgi:hypothetical protein|nr:hypothetical protein [Burkholderiales bacterium]
MTLKRDKTRIARDAKSLKQRDTGGGTAIATTFSIPANGKRRIHELGSN